MVTPILFVSVQKTVRLLLHQSQVVESWTHGIGRCDDAESELRFDVACLRVDEKVFWDGVFDIEEALFVSTLHTGLDGDVTNLLVIEEDVGSTSTIGGDEPCCR